jgi:predicted DNA-binding protein with PD1-like motif
MGRIPKGTDLLASISRIANEEEIRTGTVSVFGTVSHLVLSFFNQESRFQDTVERSEGMEIASLGGTISQFKGRSMVKLSGTFAARDGSVIGGSLTLGTIVYACEVVLRELDGGTLTRDFDIETGLPLWKENALLIESLPPEPRE